MHNQNNCTNHHHRQVKNNTIVWTCKHVPIMTFTEIVRVDRHILEPNLRNKNENLAQKSSGIWQKN